MPGQINISPHLQALREISGAYVEVSKKYIMPGVNRVGQLSLTDSSTVSQVQVEAKTKQIAAFAETAQQKINELANKVRSFLRVRFSSLPPLFLNCVPLEA